MTEFRCEPLNAEDFNKYERVFATKAEAMEYALSHKEIVCVVEYCVEDGEAFNIDSWYTGE